MSLWLVFIWIERSINGGDGLGHNMKRKGEDWAGLHS